MILKKMVIIMDNYLKQLQQKYNYNNDLLSALSKIIPGLIRYYGVENQETILSALLNCEIHIQEQGENHKEYLNNYFGVNEAWPHPIGGVAFHEARLKVDSGKADVQNMIYVFQPLQGTLDLSNDNNMGTLIHEICHLVKSYGRLKVQDDKIIVPSGLMYNEYDLNGNRLNEGDYSLNVGIEEALNCYDEEQIAQSVLGPEYKSSAYHNISDLIAKLMANEEIRVAIRKAQFTGDMSWINLLGIEESKKLIEQFDYLINMSYISNDAIDIDEDKMFDQLLEEGKNFDEIEQIIMEEVDRQTEKLWEPYHKIYDEVEHFIDNYTSQKQLDTFEQSRSIADTKMLEKIKQIQTGHIFEQNTETVGMTR